MEQPKGSGARLDFMAAGAPTSSERAPTVKHGNYIHAALPHLHYFV